MKKILFLFFGIALLSFASCTAIDNWEAPDCTFKGTVIDSYTNQPILASQNEWQIRIWERSWKGQTGGATTNQDLRIKQDGTYQNTKLFPGTYDMLPYDGPFWVVRDTTKSVELKKGKTTVQDFTVTPFLQVIDVRHEVGTHNFGTASDPVMRPSITFYCKVRAPLRQKDGVNLPNFRWVQAFLSLTVFCGNNEKIDIPEYNSNTANAPGSRGRIEINRSWAAEQTANGLDPNSDTSKEYKIGPLPVHSGYTYYTRMGANVATASNRFIYSPIEKITIP